jgi:2-polyprenyl-6-methoxyphenol hydroxylase-like FAD-dependent oxidoreductase
VKAWYLPGKEGNIMSGRTFNILIVGAGIAGLATSIALAEKGHIVTILEAAPKVHEAPHFHNLLCR